MTTTEQLSPRGYATITSANRGLVRKWLTAQGATYDQVSRLTVSELSALYNDDSRDDTALKAFISTPATHTPQTTPAHTMTTPAPQTDATAAALAALMATLTPAAPAIDDAKIIELIHAHAPKPQAVAVEVRRNGELLKTLPAGTTHAVFPLILAAVQLDNVFVSGPAGSGKTHLAEQCADALSVPFYFTGAVASEYKLTGFVDAQGRTVRTAFREAFENGGLFLFDEIDSSSPAALLAFNAALSNGKFDFPDGSVRKHKDFLCIASANTWGAGASREYVGRNQLDAATVNRFALVSMDYDHALESLIAASHYAHGSEVAALMQAYRATCRAQSVRLVISPRNTTRTAKALAAGLSLDDALGFSFAGLDYDTRSRLDKSPEVETARRALFAAWDRTTAAA